MDKTTLFIDFDDTIVSYMRSERGALEKLCNLVNMDVSKINSMVALYREKNKELWNMFQEGEINISQITSERFAYIISKFHEFANYDPEHLNKLYLRFFVQSTEIEDDTRLYLEKLKLKYNIIIVTNGIHEVQKKRMFRIGLFDLIDGFVSSEVAGAAKPRPHIFALSHSKIEEICERSIAKNEILMIGDSYSADVVGSNNYGIDACWITDEDDSKDSKYKFNTFNEACEYLLKGNQ